MSCTGFVMWFPETLSKTVKFWMNQSSLPMIYKGNKHIPGNSIYIKNCIKIPFLYNNGFRLSIQKILSFSFRTFESNIGLRIMIYLEPWKNYSIFCLTILIPLAFSSHCDNKKIASTKFLKCLPYLHNFIHWFMREPNISEMRFQCTQGERIYFGSWFQSLGSVAFQAQVWWGRTLRQGAYGGEVAHLMANWRQQEQRLYPSPSSN
jgi:hypothetical protein